MSYYVGANVVISPDVTIAPGVVLEAVAESQLVIEPGVCLGSGVVIQAFNGILTLATGVNLGQNVLIVGAGIVGARSCIGADSTLIHPQVAEQSVIPARSLLGLETSISPPQTVITTATEEQIPNDSQEAIAIVNPVYGREQVTKLLQTLFPHRDSLNS